MDETSTSSTLKFQLETLKIVPVSQVIPGKHNKRSEIPPIVPIGYIEENKKSKAQESKEIESHTDNIVADVLSLRANEAILEIHVESLVLSPSGFTLAKRVLKPHLMLTWKFLNYGKTSISKPLTEGLNYVFDYSMLYKVKVTSSFLQYLQNDSLRFSLYVTNDVTENYIGHGDLSLKNITDSQFNRILMNLAINGWDEKMQLSDASLMKTYATLTIWYKLEYDLDNITALTLSTITEDISMTTDESITISATTSHYRKSHKYLPPRVSICSGPRPTESEIVRFQDALNLVLSRNKALRTTQSEISNELHDRTKWLHNESNWKRTLQEYAILSGEDPYEVEWRQWRNHGTANVKLRLYSSDVHFYKPVFAISIISLKLYKNTTVMLNNDIIQLYIEYEFLNHEGKEMETPLSLPKSNEEKCMTFNFKKSFPIDIENDIEDCQMMAQLICKRESIQFMVISEPIKKEHEVQVCEEVGICSVNLFDLVQLEENEDIDKYEVRNIKNLEEVIGYLKIRFKGIQAARKVALIILAPASYNIIV